MTAQQTVSRCLSLARRSGQSLGKAIRVQIPAEAQARLIRDSNPMKGVGSKTNQIATTFKSQHPHSPARRNQVLA